MVQTKDQGYINVGNFAFEDVTRNLLIPQIHGGCGDVDINESIYQHLIEQIVLDKYTSNSVQSKCDNSLHDKEAQDYDVSFGCSVGV